MGLLRTSLFVVTISVAAAACGSDGPSSPSGGSNDGTIAATVTITSSGVSPKSVTVPLGSRVTFVNNDNRAHNINSDPHPEHGSCPPLDNVLNMGAGQSRTSLNFTSARTCNYHDHDNPGAAQWTGTIVVQ
jgi:plastocyanin